ncbi:MAG TPA: hypothetical protein VKQ08_05175, partial [Cyclobacteriaceae bacterium]|nr:hypothetical protein [Cyclobacteriaceae bacterium]
MKNLTFHLAGTYALCALLFFTASDVLATDHHITRTYSTSSSHSLVARTDGTVSAWGWNACGQLGDGTQINRDLPVMATGLT